MISDRKRQPAVSRKGSREKKQKEEEEERKYSTYIVCE